MGNCCGRKSKTITTPVSSTQAKMANQDGTQAKFPTTVSGRPGFQNRNYLSIAELHFVFSQFDVNGDGFISESELKQVMMRLGQEPNPDELRAMFKAADLNRDGKISFEGKRSLSNSSLPFVPADGSRANLDIPVKPISFAYPLTRVPYVCCLFFLRVRNQHIRIREFCEIAKANPLSMSLKTVFCDMDRDGDGYITREEMFESLKRMGHSISNDELNAIYRTVDLDKNSKIDFDGTSTSTYASSSISCVTAAKKRGTHLARQNAASPLFDAFAQKIHYLLFIFQSLQPKWKTEAYLH
ncbi:hypothetical protein M514_05650 [Trichuris suis]|uniref:EF-hand domain-containing protein n=1 Tax=Trichuris suis TaxID=68888 RepID=A0A085NPF0_9BILA